MRRTSSKLSEPDSEALSNMRFVRFAVDGERHCGRIDGAEIERLDGLSLDDIISGGEDALRTAGSQSASTRYRQADVHLLPPVVAHPRCVFATGWNYRSHLAEGNAARGKVVEEPVVPAFFSKPAATIVGPHDPISIDERWSGQFDYEAELAVVIGRPGRDIQPERAMEHVFGYMAGNDVSARDVQHRHGGQWFKGKAIDGTCPLGPWIVTADEIPDPHALTIECFVNGEMRQRADTSTMAFTIPRLLKELSTGMTLLPGDVLLTGTPAGVGWARTPQTFLADGDEVVTRISSIGDLRNRVVSLNVSAGAISEQAAAAASQA
jgi:2-keto-4-pentenoate hydratase/2-oxohepta-3-ene-1,7-dioic acid hydratase in catechol pathway